jgi:hypothetical protein
MTGHWGKGYGMRMDSKLTHYQIRVKGHFDRKLMAWFAPLIVTNEAQGEALLTGAIRDQAELYGVLLKLYNLNFTLVAVQAVPAVAPDL